MEFIELNITTLGSIKKKQYSLLLEPSYRCCLVGKDPDEIECADVIAIGAEDKQVPVGICVASFYPALQYANIHTIAYHSNYSPSQIIHGLLQSIEQKLKILNSTMMKMAFRRHDAKSLELSSCLQLEGWVQPKLIVIRYFFDAQTFQPEWYNRPPLLPKNVVEFPWTKLTEKEKLQVTKDFKQQRYSSHVNPFLDIEKLEPMNSLGLKHNDQVIGWMICHRVASDTIRYTALSINPEYAIYGWSLRLLVDSMQLHQLSNVKWALFELNLSGAPRSWINFVQKRLAPLAHRKIEIVETWKNFSA